MTEPRRCVVIPFFGKEWPKYFSLFKKSCEYNQMLDILLFTNLKPDRDCPPNIRFFDSSLESVSQLASSKLELDIQITSSYKLCDIRPAYGQIFEEYLTDYDFWGWGDIDLIYGDLSATFGGIAWSTVDIISFKPYWISGGFTLIANNDHNNRLYRESITWKEAFTNSSHVSFGECHKLWGRIRKGENILQIDSNQSFTYVVKKAVEEKRINAIFLNTMQESINPDAHLVVQWPEGISHFPSGKMPMLYHYITEKKNGCFVYPEWEIIPEIFVIDDSGFYTFEEFQNPFRRFVKRWYRKTSGLTHKIVQRVNH